MFINTDSPETLECHNANINVGSKMKLVLLAKRNIQWVVENMNDVKQSEHSIYQQKFDFSIEKNAELPYLKLRVALIPDDFYPGRGNSHCINLNCCLLDGYESLYKGRIFYKIDVELVGEDGSVWRKMSSENENEERLQRRGIPDLWRELDPNDWHGDEYCFHDFSLWNDPPQRLPIREDGSLSFRFTFQFFAKRVVTQLDQEVNPEMEENWLGHFETRAQADKASVEGMEEDAEVKCNNGKKIKFHKQILIARSSVFDTMFRIDMKESKTGNVPAVDMTEEQIQFMHHFLYEGRLTPYLDKIRHGENLEELEQWIHVASKYQFEDLLKFFDSILITFCDEGNAMELLRMSNQFVLKNGREDVKAFIQKHPQLLNNY